MSGQTLAYSVTILTVGKTDQACRRDNSAELDQEPCIQDVDRCEQLAWLSDHE